MNINWVITVMSACARHEDNMVNKTGRILVIVKDPDTRNKCFQYNVDKLNNETEQRVLRKHRGCACNSVWGLRDEQCSPHPLVNLYFSWLASFLAQSFKCIYHPCAVVILEDLSSWTDVFLSLSSLPLIPSFFFFCHHLCLSEAQVKCHLIYDGFSNYWNQ